MKSKHHHSTQFRARWPLPNCYSILVVDDLPENRRMLSQVLRAVGYQPLEAEDGPKAIELLQSGMRPDLVITDVEMPGMSGVETVTEIRAMSSGAATVPIIAASGNPEVSLRQDMLEAGADAFLRKPMDISELLETVRGLLQPSFDRNAVEPEVVPDTAK
jgi:CheY-like chemotaxis protein